MGWRDINMSRRRPLPKLAVVPVESGMDFVQAVLRKVAAEAVASLRVQLDGDVPVGLSPFLSGYLLGHACQTALKHGVDVEAQANAMVELAEALTDADCSEFSADPQSVSFCPRGRPRASARTALRAAPALGDAGYLVGHLEALCGSTRLARLAVARAALGEAGIRAYLTDCDTAADPMQTRAPTMNLRFTQEEREVVTAGFAELLKVG